MYIDHGIPDAAATPAAPVAMGSIQSRSGCSSAIAFWRSATSCPARASQASSSTRIAPIEVRAFQSSTWIASMRGSIGAASRPSCESISTFGAEVRIATSWPRSRRARMVAIGG